jgi:hypothetical protein
MTPPVARLAALRVVVVVVSRQRLALAILAMSITRPPVLIVDVLPRFRSFHAKTARSIVAIASSLIVLRALGAVMTHAVIAAIAAAVMAAVADAADVIVATPASVVIAGKTHHIR